MLKRSLPMIPTSPMKLLLAVISLVYASVCAGDTLRISELADGPGEGAERMVITHGDSEKEYFVKKKTLLGDSDVEQAWPDPARQDAISVKLNDAGAKKLNETTAKMRHGKDQLAIIVDGRLISAPVVTSTLNNAFIISGFRDLEHEDLDNLARRMSGLPPRPEGEQPMHSIPQIQSIPFTEEEYQARKAEREKLGVFHLESLPNEDELNNALRKGMTREDVIERFGRPFMAGGNSNWENFSIFFQIAPEKRPDNPQREMRPDGFKTDFVDGKLVRWSHTYSNAQREGKVPGMQQPMLNVILPEMDVAADDFDMVAFVEGIRIPEPTQHVNMQDMMDLVSTITMLAATFGEEAENLRMDANCDFMKTLSHNFAEVAELRKQADGDKLRISVLNALLAPYAYGEKEFPRRVDADESQQDDEK